MSCGNQYKHMLQNAVNSFLNIFTALESNSSALTDNQMECLQFGIFSFVPKTTGEIPYFHY
tara:strand:- start:503 stop:685 length:183 start_codon:yes stop_codon:yes gene_type:complete